MHMQSDARRFLRYTHVSRAFEVITDWHNWPTALSMFIEFGRIQTQDWKTLWNKDLSFPLDFPPYESGRCFGSFGCVQLPRRSGWELSIPWSFGSTWPASAQLCVGSLLPLGARRRWRGDRMDGQSWLLSKLPMARVRSSSNHAMSSFQQPSLPELPSGAGGTLGKETGFSAWHEPCGPMFHLIEFVISVQICWAMFSFVGFGWMGYHCTVFKHTLLKGYRYFRASLRPLLNMLPTQSIAPKMVGESV